MSAAVVLANLVTLVAIRALATVMGAAIDVPLATISIRVSVSVSVPMAQPSTLPLPIAVVPQTVAHALPIRSAPNVQILHILYITVAVLIRARRVLINLVLTVCHAGMVAAPAQVVAAITVVAVTTCLVGNAILTATKFLLNMTTMALNACYVRLDVIHAQGPHVHHVLVNIRFHYQAIFVSKLA